MKEKNPLSDYDPNAVGMKDHNIFGLPFSSRDARLVFIPVPWDVTTSHVAGTSGGPANILQQSYQIDLFSPSGGDAWKQGMAMEEIDAKLLNKNKIMRQKAVELINFLENGGEIEEHASMQQHLESINKACDEVMTDVQEKSLKYLENKQLPFLVGGDHSISTGLIHALAGTEEFGILQIDAHADLRKDYQGFKHSHASVMRNALNTKGVTKIVQVGIRELCPEELDVINGNPIQIKTFFDHHMHQRLFIGEAWDALCREIVEQLPAKVYISFDVDGLEPSLCPGTGTPVPGGLSYNQALYLLESVLKSGKRIIGADLVETGQTTTDGIVSCRLLFHMASMMIKSNKR